MSEEWRPVVGWEGLYEVSSLGRVRSLDRLRVSSQGKTWVFKGRILKQAHIAGGYRSVGLSRPGENIRVRVHRAVCEAFHGPEPEGKPFVLHGDGSPGNNRVENLRWGSHSENMYDSVKHGTHHVSSRTHCPEGHRYDSESTYVTSQGHRNCRICHRLNARRVISLGLDPGDSRHGTNSGYANNGCRCDPCKKARSTYIEARKRETCN